jgi:integrase/recombinase XerD
MAMRARAVPEVNVKSRHREDCKRKSDGNYITCICPKQLLYSRNGKLYRISAATNDWQIAENKARELQERFERAAKGEPEPVATPGANGSEEATVAEAVARYIQSKRDANYTEKSIGKLQLWFEKRLVQFANRKNLLYIPEIKLAHLEEWRSEWKGEATTRAKIQGRVVGFFDWCLRRDLISKNPALGLERIKTNGRKPTIALTDAHFEQVLKAIPKINGETTDEQRTKLRALVLLMRWSGLSIRDALTLERTKLVAGADGWAKLFLRRAKTGVEVYCTIAPETTRELLALQNDDPKYFFWDGEGSKEALVQKWGVLFRKLSTKAALKDEHDDPLDFHSHMLRDTFAVWCFNSGMATEDVAALLGHSNIQITQQHYSPWVLSRAERLGDMVKQAHRRTSLATAATAGSNESTV